MLTAMKISRPTRRWYEISLRTLLVSVALFAIPYCWLAVKLRQVQREEEAAAAIAAVGGVAAWDENAAERAWLHGILGEHFLRHVRSVTLQDERVTDSRLEALDAMKHLQSLDLYNTQV